MTPIVEDNLIQAEFRRERVAHVRARIVGAVRSGPVESFDLLYLFPNLSEKRARERIAVHMRAIGAKPMGGNKDRWWEIVKEMA